LPARAQGVELALKVGCLRSAWRASLRARHHAQHKHAKDKQKEFHRTAPLWQCFKLAYLQHCHNQKRSSPLFRAGDPAVDALFKDRHRQRASPITTSWNFW
jgi:hypothetical protein